jgi:hypothetical protein
MPMKDHPRVCGELNNVAFANTWCGTDYRGRGGWGMYIQNKQHKVNTKLKAP